FLLRLATLHFARMIGKPCPQAAPQGTECRPVGAHSPKPRKVSQTRKGKRKRRKALDVIEGWALCPFEDSRRAADHTPTPAIRWPRPGRGPLGSGPKNHAAGCHQR